MTVNTWRNDIFNICKYCRHFIDLKKSRNRYHCGKFQCHINDAHECKKTFSIRKQASKISKKALHKAFFALTESEYD